MTTILGNLARSRGEATSSRLRDLRARTDDLLRLETELDQSSRALNNEHGRLADAWLAVRKREADLDARQRAIEVRERRQAQREGEALDQHVQRTLEGGRRALDAVSGRPAPQARPASQQQRGAYDPAAMAASIQAAAAKARGHAEAQGPLDLPPQRGEVSAAARATAAAIMKAADRARRIVQDDRPELPNTAAGRVAASIMASARKARGEA